MSNGFLSQEEIDALLSPDRGAGDGLDDLEKDTMGEIGNISMGSAATTLSQLLNQRVNITTPVVSVTTQEELFKSFEVPYLVIEVNFVEGLSGTNLLVIHEPDALVIADLMMGGTGENVGGELDELKKSAVAEAMNQMMGSAATAMSTMFRRKVTISPPSIIGVRSKGEPYEYPFDRVNPVVAVCFRMMVGDLIDSRILQVMPIDVAKAEADLLLGRASQPEEGGRPISETMPGDVSSDQPASVGAQLPTSPEAPLPRNLELILDVPLRVSVILGRTRRTIKELVSMGSGAILELDRLAGEPVEVLVNGKVIAYGEVVAVNENFGVRIVSIVSPAERVNNLRG